MKFDCYPYWYKKKVRGWGISLLFTIGFPLIYIPLYTLNIKKIVELFKWSIHLIPLYIIFFVVPWALLFQVLKYFLVSSYVSGVAVSNKEIIITYFSNKIITFSISDISYVEISLGFEDVDVFLKNGRKVTIQRNTIQDIDKLFRFLFEQTNKQQALKA